MPLVVKLKFSSLSKIIILISAICSTLSCGYFKVDISNSKLSSFSTNSLSIQKELLSNPLNINEGSFLDVTLILNKSVNYDSHFDIIFEGTKGESANLYFDLSQNTISIPTGQTTASFRITPIDDAIFNNPSQWTFRLVSNNMEIISMDSLTFTLIDNDNINGPTFGKIKSNFGTVAYSSETATAIQIMNDSKIIVAGYSNASGSNDFTVIKYNLSGVLDGTFGNNGKVTTDLNAGSNDQPLAIKLQDDGKIIIAGTSNPNGNSDLAIVRYTTSGTLDTTFGNNGKVFTDIGAGSSDIAQALQIQNDGKILIGGYTNVNGENDFLLVRYTPNGLIDLSFGVNGKIVTDVSGNDFVYDMKIQSDGKILLAGSAFNNNYDFALVRFTTEGNLDSTFGNSNGIVLTDISASSTDYGSSIEILNDGKILFAGTTNNGSNNDIALIQFTTLGEIDTTFGINGKVITDIGTNTSDNATSIQIKNDGKILVAGYTNSFNSDFLLVQYLASGTLDTGFGFNGKVISDLGTSSKDMVYDFTLQSDEKIMLIGSSDMIGSSDFALIRYDAQGLPDTSFGVNARVMTDIGTGSADTLSSIKLQTDGKIILGGYSNTNINGNYDFALMRYNTSGSIDTTFGSNGKITTDLNSNSSDYITNLEIQNDGKIVAAGYSTMTNTSHVSLVRYLDTGVLDASFGVNGKINTEINSQSIDKVNAMIIQPNGKILITGSTRIGLNSDFILIRYTSLGVLDSNFGTNGVVITDIGTNTWDEAYSLQLQTQGKILVAGISNTNGNQDFTIVRYNNNGTLDTTFGNNGKVITNLGGNDFAYDIQVQKDKKFLIAGTSNASGSNDYVIARYLPNGDLDSLFGNNGIVTIDIGNSSNDVADSLKIKDEGEILISGYSNINGRFNSTVIQLTQQGQLDSIFGKNGKIILDVNSNYIINKNPIAVQSDGNIYIGSTSKEFDFTSFDFLLFRIDKNGNPN